MSMTTDQTTTPQATPRAPKSYEIQPVGIPAEAKAALGADAVDTVLHALMDCIKAWRPSEDWDGDIANHRRLIMLGEALAIMGAAYLDVYAPVDQAHRDDAAAAEDWETARWFART